jgi:two-component system LytT family response regulator
MKTTCIIIDDMELARRNLRQLLTTHIPEVDIIGEADGVVSGAKLLRSSQADILFLDIHLGDGEGFDILEIVPDTSTKVIFTTASDEHAIKAFRYAAIDYLLKPIDPEEMKEAIDKAVSKPTQQYEQLDLLRSTLSNHNTKKIALHTSDQILIVDIQDIVRMEANGNYTQFYFADQTKLLITKTLKEFDKILQEDGFLRTHQSHLINPEFIKAFVKTEGGYIEMKDGSIVPVSVRKKAGIMDALAKM